MIVSRETIIYNRSNVSCETLLLFAKIDLKYCKYVV